MGRCISCEKPNSAAEEFCKKAIFVDTAYSKRNLCRCHSLCSIEVACHAARCNNQPIRQQQALYFWRLSGPHILLLFVGGLLSIMSEQPKEPPKDNVSAEEYAYVRLSYSPDPAEEEAYLAYQECLLENMEREAAKNPTEADRRFALMLQGTAGGIANLNYKTPSPNIRDSASAFVPLTQPPAPNPYVSRRSGAVAPNQLHGIFNPYGTLSDHMTNGRRSAPPMLPSPPSNVKNTASLKLPPKPPKNSTNGNLNARKPAAAKNKKNSAGVAVVGQGAGGGSMHYRDEELHDLMDIMEDVLPIGKYEKERVAERYNANHPLRPREYPNLMSQFNKFASKKPPTGDPNCPPLVRRAKQITRKIKDKAGVACFNEEEQEEDLLVYKESSNKKRTSAVVGSNQDDPKPSAAVRSKKSRKEETTKSLIEIFLANEMASSKKEEMLERRRHEERQQLLQLGIGVLHSFASAFTGAPLPVDSSLLAPARLTPSDSDSYSSSSCSEVSFDIADYAKKSVKTKSFNQKLEEWKKAREKKKKMRKNKKKKSRSDAMITMLDSSDEEELDTGDKSNSNGGDKTTETACV
jgi:hypothetical protein